MFFRRLLDLIPPAPPVHGEDERRLLRRKAAQLASTGNVLVQRGCFATKTDIEARKKTLLYSEE